MVPDDFFQSGNHLQTHHRRKVQCLDSGTLLLFPISHYNAWAPALYMPQHPCPDTRIMLKMAVGLFLAFIKELGQADPRRDLHFLMHPHAGAGRQAAGTFGSLQNGS